MRFKHGLRRLRQKQKLFLLRQKIYKKTKSLEENNFPINLDFSLTNCVCLLEGIEQIDDDTYMKIVEKFKDPYWREIFVNMFG